MAHTRARIPLPTLVDIIKKEMPNPTPEEMASPQFEAIWNIIKTWDINVPEY